MPLLAKGFTTLTMV